MADCECQRLNRVSGRGLAVRSPVRLTHVRVDQISVGDVQFEDTIPAIQVRLGAGRVVGVGAVLLLKLTYEVF